MPNYLWNNKFMVRIIDTDGSSVRVSLAFSLTGLDGDWKTIDKGFIRHESGQNSMAESIGKLTSYHLDFNTSADKCGIRLYDWQDILGINDGGSGILFQQWGLALKPGRISWYVM
jgi:hypothetical protein